MSYFDMDSTGMSGGPLRAVNDGMLGEYGPLRAVRDGSLGEYFAANGVGEYFATNGVGEYFAANGLGATSILSWAMSPALATARALSPRATQGLGSELTQRQQAAAAIIGTLIAGFFSYHAGSAMAPKMDVRRKWGWTGAVVGGLTGPLGLGIMGMVSNGRKKGV